jgi:hypothetical protein
MALSARSHVFIPEQGSAGLLFEYTVDPSTLTFIRSFEAHDEGLGLTNINFASILSVV